MFFGYLHSCISCVPTDFMYCICKNGVGVYEPLFNLEYIRQTWYFILAFGILGVTRDSVRLIDGSYTKRVMLVTIITNIIDGVLTSIWLLNDRIMNSGFLMVLSSYLERMQKVFHMFLYTIIRYFSQSSFGINN